MALNFKWSLLLVLFLCITSVYSRNRIQDLKIRIDSQTRMDVIDGYYISDEKQLKIFYKCNYRGENGICRNYKTYVLPLNLEKDSHCNTSGEIYEVNVYDRDGDHTREILDVRYVGQNKKSNRIYISFENGCRIQGKFNYQQVRGINI